MELRTAIIIKTPFLLLLKSLKPAEGKGLSKNYRLTLALELHKVEIVDKYFSSGHCIPGLDCLLIHTASILL